MHSRNNASVFPQARLGYVTRSLRSQGFRIGSRVLASRPLRRLPSFKVSALFGKAL